MIVTVTVNPALDRTAGVEKLRIGGLNRLGEVVEDCGGKGVNVSKAVAALGGESVATGFMGGGAAGESLLGLIDAVAGVRADFVPVAAPARVNLKIVETVGGVLTEFNEAGAAVTPGEVDALTAKLAGQAVPGAVFVFSGSLCPGLPEDCYATWIALAHEAGATALLDASGQALRRGLVARPDLVKPNWPELADLVGWRAAPPEASQIARLAAGLGPRRVVVSLGADGAVFVEDGRAWAAPGLPVAVASPVGAGDAMVAALAMAAEGGRPLVEAAALAMAAGAAAAATEGTGPPAPESVAELARRVELRPLV